MNGKVVTLVSSVLVLIVGISSGNVTPQTHANPFEMEVVGGNGGVPFYYVCPNNGWLVGVDGRAGAFIDSFRLLCAPLPRETRKYGNHFVDPRLIGNSQGGQYRRV